MIRALAFAATCLAIALVSGAARAHALDEVRARGELVWGGDLQGGEPYVFEDPAHKETIIGFEVEIADALAKRLGVRARFRQTDWSSLVPALERRDFDIILNGLEATAERRDRLLLSRPYYVYREILAVRKGAESESLADLRGKRVGTLNQTFAFQLLKAQPLETVIYEGQQEPYADLDQGRIDAVLLEDVIANRYGCVLAGVECLPNEVARGVYVIGMRKGDDALKKAIDDALDAMTASGELRAILTKWKLWNDAQGDLAATPAAEPPPPAADRFDRAKVVLFVQGAAVTLALTFAAFAIALTFGWLLAIARLYGGAPVRALSAAYVEVFRGTPLLLQLYVLYYGLAPIVRLGAFEAAVIGLGLNYAAYEAEIYRGALLSIPRGQVEAASALGLSRAQSLRHVLLPQAFRHALPATTNDFVALLKDSSLVSVITVVELTKRMTITAVEVRSWLVPGLACAALYFAMSFPLSRLARTIEKRLVRDSAPRFA